MTYFQAGLLTYLYHLLLLLQEIIVSNKQFSDFQREIEENTLIIPVSSP